jgi:anti-sigma regulatory factor (Ser/Thr protein kinase)
MPTPTSIADVRSFLAFGLNFAGCPPSTVDAAVLLASELATNAVVHAATLYSVEFRYVDDKVTVAVGDTGSGTPEMRQPGIEGGHGLRLVDAISDDWGVRPERPGKSVYFNLAS